MRRTPWLAALALLAGCAPAQGAAPAPVDPAPAALWRTSVAQAMSTVQVLTDQTCREVLRVTSGGSAVRLRLSHATGSSAVRLSAVTVRANGLSATVTVDGRRAVDLAPGSQVVSDPVRLAVAPGDELVVSLAVSGRATVSAHRVGAAALSCTAPGTGDRTESTSAQGFAPAGRQGLVVDDVAVLGGPRAVLAVGDSLTDPELPPGTYPRWTDVLDAKLPADVPVSNAAIAGNRVLLPGGYGPTLVQRFARDVLARDGVGTVVLLAGTNDVSRDLPAARLTAELAQLCRLARDRGVRVVLLTLPPASKRPPAQEAVRQRVNDWIRSTTLADVVVDADAVLRAPGQPTRLLPAYDRDHLHLTPAGHRALGEAVAAALR